MQTTFGGGTYLQLAKIRWLIQRTVSFRQIFVGQIFNFEFGDCRRLTGLVTAVITITSRSQTSVSSLSEYSLVLESP